MSDTPKSSSSSLILGLAAAVILALGVGVLVYRQPAPPAESPAPPPTTATAAAQPDAAGADASAASGSAAAPGGAPATAAEPGQTAPAGTKAATPTKAGGTGPAGTSGRPGEKPSLGGPRGTAGAPPPLTAQAMMRRSFVASRTASENVKGVSKDLSGFDAKKSKEVRVKRAPEIDARIEFNTTPQRVKPGEKYRVRISFVNEGKKPIEIKDLVVTTRMNGKEESTSVKPLVKEVASRQNEIVHEISGVWDKSTTSWTVQAKVTSNRLDMYRNELVWK